MVAGTLKYVSVSDLWTQACRRPSKFLSFVSTACHNLLELELKNSWLSLDGLKSMPMLTCLTLEYVRLDDEDLYRLIDCFSSLEVLNLIELDGLDNPKVHHLKLKTFLWTFCAPENSSEASPSSITIIAPKLVSLELECATPWKVYIEAPLLSDFHLALEDWQHFKVEELYTLKTLSLDSSYICALIMASHTAGKATKNLILDEHEWEVRPPANIKVTIEKLFMVFPNLSSLTLKSGAWSIFEASGRPSWWDSWEGRGNAGKELKEFKAYLRLDCPEMTQSSVFNVLEKCTNLSDMCLLIHCNVTLHILREFVTRCMDYRPDVRWSWGIWGEDVEDVWIS